MNMKRTTVSLGIAFALFLVLGFNPAISADKETFEEKFEKTLDLARDGKVIVGNISGDIEIKTWNRAQVQIDALKKSTSTTMDKAEENADKVKIEISEENSTVRIQTVYPKGNNQGLNVSVYYILTIPAAAAINASTVSGDVTLASIGGSLKAKSISGDVVLTGAKEGAILSTTSGDVEAKDVDGDVDLHTVSGDVIAEAINGSVEADTVSGNVELSNITGADEVDASTTSGRVTYEGEISSSGYYHLKSHSGRVEFIVPAGAGFDVDARTFSGSINSEFEITVLGKIDKKSLRGSINGGGAEVELYAFSGNIYLKKK